MAKRSNERSYPKHLTLLAASLLAFGAPALLSDTASAQLLQQLQKPQQHAQVIRRAATRTNPPEHTNTIPDPATAPPSAAIDKTSALGQALAACNQDSAVQEAFTLPGLKGEVTLDRCYKGRSHLSCVLTALSTEATSLTKAYTKIVDAKYPELTTVDAVCQIDPTTLASDIAGSEDFLRRFKELKFQYDATTRCTANVEQAFKEVVLADMTQAPEVINSMTASLEADVANIAKVHEKISDLSAKMDQSNKAMKAITKVHHAMCMREKAAERPSN